MSPEQRYTIQIGKPGASAAPLATTPAASSSGTITRTVSLTPEAVFAAAMQFQQRGELAEALVCYGKLLEVRPDHADSWYNAGLAHYGRGDMTAAEAHFRRAVELRPNYELALHNLGFMLYQRGQHSAAIDALQQAWKLNPRDGQTGMNLANALAAQGRIDEAIEIGSQSLDDPKFGVDAHNNLLLNTHYRYGTTITGLATLHGHWRTKHDPRSPVALPFAVDRNPERTLRVGVLSGDLASHAVGFMFLPVAEQMDRRAIEWVAYSSVQRRDPWNERFRRAIPRWHDIAAWETPQLVQQMRDDRLDIVLDLAGHTAHGRLPALAERVAPLQISWIGYPGPSAPAAIDYHLADRWLVPDELLPNYTTPILRLPTTITCYEIPGATPEVGQLPALRTGKLLLASFNKPQKINDIVIETWSTILHALPEARLLLKFLGFDDPGTIARFQRRFALQGIDAARLLFEGHGEFHEMFHRYLDVDLALDPFPFTGGTTSYLATWMGVPIVTCPGEIIASRQTYAMYEAIGVRDTIAVDRAAYVRLAVDLARDLPRLSELRQKLRPAYRASPLADSARVARELAEVLRGAWRTWCERAPA